MSKCLVETKYLCEASRVSEHILTVLLFLTVDLTAVPLLRCLRSQICPMPLSFLSHRCRQKEKNRRGDLLFCFPS